MKYFLCRKIESAAKMRVILPGNYIINIYPDESDVIPEKIEFPIPYLLELTYTLKKNKKIKRLEFKL